VPSHNESVVHVQFIQPAIEDLLRLSKKNKELLRQVLKKILLIERNPFAGHPLLGGFIGWRKLTVGDRHWRIIWRTHTDELGAVIIEIAEIWAIGARADSKIYKELRDRLDTLAPNQKVQSLREVIAFLGHGEMPLKDSAIREPVPPWLANRLLKNLHISQAEIDLMDAEGAMSIWENYLINRGL
jgi:mRNA interferase RelE/StbE